MNESRFLDVCILFLFCDDRIFFIRFSINKCDDGSEKVPVKKLPIDLILEHLNFCFRILFFIIFLLFTQQPKEVNEQKKSHFLLKFKRILFF